LQELSWKHRGRTFILLRPYGTGYLVRGEGGQRSKATVVRQFPRLKPVDRSAKIRALVSRLDSGLVVPRGFPVRE
jgi:hypothetical protein